MKTSLPVKVGDYCRAYNKGIHRVVAIEFPTVRASLALVTLEGVLDSTYRPYTKRHTCDISYCVKVTKEQLLKEVGDTYLAWTQNIEKALSVSAA